MVECYWALVGIGIMELNTNNTAVLHPPPSVFAIATLQIQLDLHIPRLENWSYPYLMKEQINIVAETGNIYEW